MAEERVTVVQVIRARVNIKQPFQSTRKHKGRRAEGFALPAEPESLVGQH